MARIENVTFTILANSYYEILTTTDLGTEKIDGGAVVTEQDDVFLVRSALITIKELNALVDAKLLNQKDAAVRFHALSVALDPDTTDAILCDELEKYKFHPELVRVVEEMGKGYVIETTKLLKLWKTPHYDGALARAASEGRVETMAILKDWGATHYHWALAASAAAGQLDALNLLNVWGVKNYDTALATAACNGRTEAMKLLKTLGATDYDLALRTSSEGGRLEAMKLLKNWGATHYDRAFEACAFGGHVEALTLLKTWGAKNYDRALRIAAGCGYVKAMTLLKSWGATDFDRALSETSHLEAKSLLEEWIASRD